MEHWQQYANPALAEQLEKYSGGLAHDYDWRLNKAEIKALGICCDPIDEYLCYRSGAERRENQSRRHCTR